MSYAQSDFSFSVGMKKIIGYYLGFSILFFLIHLSLISIVTFFHFLIDHDMHIIENWLDTNAWEVIIISKLIASFCIFKILKLNNYFVNNLLTILKEDTWKPSSLALGFVLFEAICILALLLKGIHLNEKFDGESFISYIGSTLFYLIDFLVISVLLRSIKIRNKRKYTLLIFSLLTVFICFTKITLPLVGKYSFFLILHFLSMMILLVLEKKNIMNIILYSLVVIGPLSTFYGFDLIWGSSQSVYLYKESLPVFGIVGIWLIGMVYYYKGVRRARADYA